MTLTSGNSALVEGMTIDDLATASQQEFQVLRGEIAGVKQTQETILRAVEKINVRLSSYSSRWSDDFARLHEWLTKLDGRVKVLEKSKSE